MAADPSMPDPKYIKWSKYHGDSMNTGYSDCFTNYFNALKLEQFKKVARPPMFMVTSGIYERELFYDVGLRRWRVVGARRDGAGLLARIAKTLFL